MNARTATLIAMLGLPGIAGAQGFAGLGSEAGGFAVPEPGYALTFPLDHGAHPDYRIEWWYVTANLTGADGTDYGLQWTLFRTALAPGEGEGWASPQLWMGHAAVTTRDAHHVAERIARGGIGQAGVTAGPFVAWIDDWEMTEADCRYDVGITSVLRRCGPDGELALRATGTDFAYDMIMTARGPFVLHGDAGYSVKSADGQASYYYSQPYYSVSGVLTLPEGAVEVTGAAWLDREWSSQPLSDDQTGWDWFSLSFADGSKMMGFALRSDDGASFTSASWIEPDGSVTAYPDGALVAVPLDSAEVAGRMVPVVWQVTLPDRALDVTVSALNPQSWMEVSVPYWEGPVRVSGSHEGRGYLEMTGY